MNWCSATPSKPGKPSTPGRAEADFLGQLRSDPEVKKHFADGELEDLCSLDFHTRNVQAKFDAVFGPATPPPSGP